MFRGFRRKGRPFYALHLKWIRDFFFYIRELIGHPMHHIRIGAIQSASKTFLLQTHTDMLHWSSYQSRVAHLLSIQEWSDLTLQLRGAYTLSRISGYSWRTRDAVWINLIEEMRVLVKTPPPLLLTTTPRALIGRAARCCRIVRPRRVTFALSHPTTSSAPLPLDLWSEYPEVRLELDIGARADSHADILDAAERLSSSNCLWTSHSYFLKYHLRYCC